uniref:I/LWEQ domain-containing protein n=1 Tax=Macrostomum lignano TaxID=282301 RepID=A0A1I8ITR4_9PLAT
MMSEQQLHSLADGEESQQEGTTPPIDEGNAPQQENRHTVSKRTLTWKANCAAQSMGAALPHAKAAQEAAAKAVENAETDQSATADGLKAVTKSIQDALGGAGGNCSSTNGRGFWQGGASRSEAAASEQGGASRRGRGFWAGRASRPEAKAELAKLTESAAKDLVRALEGTEAVAKTASDTIETPERLALAHTASKLVLSCAKAAAEIAAESKRLSETLASPQADQLEEIEENKINRINDALNGLQLQQNRPPQVPKPLTNGPNLALNCQFVNGRDNLFSVAAEHGLLKFKAEAIKAAAAAAKELVTASVETVKLATEASIAAGGSDANACKSAVSVASYCARHTVSAAWLLAEAFKSAASDDPDETVAAWAANHAKTAVDEIRKLQAEFQQNGSSPVRLTLDSRCKLVGFVVFFVIVMLAFVVEVRAYHEYQKYENEHQTGKRRRKICLGCRVSRLLFVTLAVISILLLECWVLKSGRARLAYVGAVRISNVPASISAPVKLCNLPSALFASAFLLFLLIY